MERRRRRRRPRCCCKVNLCCVSLGNSFSVGLFVANIESDSRGENWLELETDQFSSAAAVADFFLVLVKVGRFLLRSAL